MIKVKDQEGTARIPNQFSIQIPLLNESDLIVPLEIELELFKPKSEDDKPMLKLSCPLLTGISKQLLNMKLKRLEQHCLDIT